VSLLATPDSHLNVTPVYGEGSVGPDQLTKFGTRSFTYDSAGRVLNDGLRTMRWDAKGRLAEVTTGDSSERYVYAFDGSRAEKRSGSDSLRARYIAEECATGARSVVALFFYAAILVSS